MRANFGGNGSASPSVGFRPPAHPPNAPTGAAPRAAGAAPPSLSGLDARNALCGLPARASCGCYSAPRSLRSLGAVLPACGARPPALRGLPTGGQAAGSLRSPTLPRLRILPPCIPLRSISVGQTLRRVTVLPSVGLASARLSPRAHPSLPPFGRSVRLCPGSTRSPHCTPLRSVPVGPRLRLKAKPARRGVARLWRLTAGLRPPLMVGRWGALKLTTAAVGKPPCALPSVGHRLSVFPWRLPPSLGVPSGAPHEAAARRSLRSLCLAPPSSWLSLPSVARPCRGGSPRASLRFAATRPRSLRPRAAMPLSLADAAHATQAGPGQGEVIPGMSCLQCSPATLGGTPNHRQREGATSGFPRCARSPAAL